MSCRLILVFAGASSLLEHNYASTLLSIPRNPLYGTSRLRKARYRLQYPPSPPLCLSLGPDLATKNRFKEDARTRRTREFILQALSFDLYPHYLNPLKRFPLSVGVLRLFADSRELC